MCVLYRKIKVKFWDIGGQSSFIGLWENYYSVCDGLIFVFDVSLPVDRLVQVRKTLGNSEYRIMSMFIYYCISMSLWSSYQYVQCLDFVLNHKEISGRKVPHVILGHKTDLLDSASLESIIHLFSPHSIVLTQLPEK